MSRTAGAAALLVANHRQFLAFLEKRVGGRAIAEDILQDAFVRGMAKLDGLRNEESAVAWFYRLPAFEAFVAVAREKLQPIRPARVTPARAPHG